MQIFKLYLKKPIAFIAMLTTVHAAAADEPLELEMDLDFNAGMGIETQFSSGSCGTTGELDYMEARMVISQHQQQFQQIFQAFAADNPGYGGKVEFNIEIGAAGNIKHVQSISGQDLPFSKLLVDEFYNIQFPKCSAPTRVTHALSFGPTIDIGWEKQENTCLSEQEITRTIDRHHQEIYAIYRSALIRKPDLEGAVKFEISIFPSGNTESVKVVSGHALNIAPTVGQFLQTVRYPSCNEESKFTIPIRFLASPPDSAFQLTPNLQGSERL